MAGPSLVRHARVVAIAVRAVSVVALGSGVWAADALAQEVSQCHPAYDECVPIGPEGVPPCDRVPDFAFPVGEDDPLGLDPDGDGVGCEASQETIWGDDLCEIAYCR